MKKFRIEITRKDGSVNTLFSEPNNFRAVKSLDGHVTSLLTFDWFKVEKALNEGARKVVVSVAPPTEKE